MKTNNTKTVAELMKREAALKMNDMDIVAKERTNVENKETVVTIGIVVNEYDVCGGDVENEVSDENDEGEDNGGYKRAMLMSTNTLVKMTKTVGRRGD